MGEPLGVGIVSSLIGKSGMMKIISITEIVIVKAGIKFVSEMPEKYLSI